MLRLKTILQFNYIYIIFIIFVILLSFIRVNIPRYSFYKENEKVFIGTLKSYNIDGNKFSFIIHGKEDLKGTYYIKSVDELRIISNLKLGIKLRIEGSLNKPSNNTIPHTFNYKNYLYNNHIFYIVNVDNLKVINNKTNFIYKIKNCLINRIKQYKSQNYLYAFILGDKKNISEEYKQYQTLGVSHIFAISGMHISLLSLIFIKVFNKFKYKYFITIIFLILYTCLLGLQPSVLRSTVFFILLYYNNKYALNINTLNILYLTICLILIYEPFYLYNTGFQYSSIISFALIKYNRIIRGDYIVKCLKISTIALLFSLPISINNNFEINVLSIFNNLFFVPLISFVIYPLSLLSLIIKPLDIILFKMLNLLEIISSHLLVFNITIPKLNLIFIFLYYLFIYLFFHSYNFKFLFIGFILLMINKYKFVIDNNYYIYYLDVNQGDSTMIKYKNKSILIDTGGKTSFIEEDWKKKKNYYYQDTNIIFYKSIGINKIDYLILSHGDYDHMGEANYLVYNFKVENVIFNNDDFNELEMELIKLLNNKKIKYYKGLKELNIGKNKIHFLNTKEYGNENDNSNVIYFKLNNYKFLFMGDAGIEREKDIFDKYNLTDINFIKIGHHGSNTSSSEYFIDSIKPKNCLISVGKNNRYGHPKESVLDILNDYCDIYRTDLNGSIEIKINNNGYKVKTYSS